MATLDEQAGPPRSDVEHLHSPVHRRVTLARISRKREGVEDVDLANPSRFPELDGMRGLAALAVAMSHLLGALAPFVWDGRSAAESPLGYETSLERTLANVPLRLLWEGNFAVLFFFVHSGFVLSISSLRTRSSTVPLEQQAARRFIRIGLPVSACVLIIFGLSRLGLYSDAIWNGQTVHPNVSNLRSNLFGGVLIRGDHSYATPLWSMSVEIFMSFGVFAFLALYRRARFFSGWLVGWTTVGWMVGAHYAPAFALGVLIAQAITSESPRKTIVRLARSRLAVALALIGAIALGTFPPVPSIDTWHLRLIDPQVALIFPSLGFSERRIIVQSLAGVLLLFAAIRMRPLRNLLRTRGFTWLGRMSFPLYLMHLPVQAVILAPTYVAINAEYGRQIAIIALLLVAPIAWMLASQLFSIAIDQPSIELGRRCNGRTGAMSVVTHVVQRSYPLSGFSLWSRLAQRPLPTVSPLPETGVQVRCATA